MPLLHQWSLLNPSKPALVDLASQRTVSFGDLDRHVQHAASWLVSLGLDAGAGIVILMENRPEIIELGLSARRAGLYFTVVSTHLTAPELAYIVRDSGAMVMFVSRDTAPSAASLVATGELEGIRVFNVDADDGPDAFASCVRALAAFHADAPLPERAIGRDMLYSSGTTGLPKGIRRPLLAGVTRDKPEPEVEAWRRAFGFDEHTVYLSPAPLYHAAPLRYVMRTIEAGGTAILMKKFDALTALQVIDQYRVTHSQWVPTMFVRMLELPQAVRDRYDLRSMRVAIHAAAPCPIHVKQALLDWWGDIVYEYYAGSEGVGITAIGPRDWRNHPGSVGRASMGVIHVVDEAGQELPAGQVGKIYFSGGPRFTYWNDPQKTEEAYNEHGWATYGDMGYVDDEGFLYLVDRRTDLILSGGVNVYPQEIENAISQHPQVQDVAVVGVPDVSYGQVPKAIVQLRDPAMASEAMAQELVTFCGAHLSKIKMPRSIVFEENLPRMETGKLLRRVLKERYQTQPDAGYRVRS